MTLKEWSVTGDGVGELLRTTYTDHQELSEQMKFSLRNYSNVTFPDQKDSFLVNGSIWDFSIGDDQNPIGARRSGLYRAKWKEFFGELGMVALPGCECKPELSPQQQNFSSFSKLQFPFINKTT